MPLEKLTLTDEEQTLINKVYHSGVLDDVGWARFFERVKRAPRREGAIKSALYDEGLWSRVERDLYGIKQGFLDPGIGVEAAKEHFEHHGIVGGLADIAVQSVTTPIRAIGSVATGKGLGERPLETAVGIASVVPVGRLAGFGLSAGLRGVGRAGAANALSRGLRTPAVTNIARVVEAGDVVTGIEEWPLEVIGEGMLEGGSLGLSRLGMALGGEQAQTPEVPEGGPPPDVPPQAQDVPPTEPQQQQPVSEQVTPEMQQQQEQAQTPEVPEGGPPPDVPPQAQDVPPTEPQQQQPVSEQVTPEMQQQQEREAQRQQWNNVQTRMWNNPDTDMDIVVKRVPSPETGTLDNRHWQVWFAGPEGSGAEHYSADSPMSFTAEDDIKSYEGAREAAVQKFTDTVDALNQEQETSREKREQRNAEQSEARQQKREGGEQPAGPAQQEDVEPTPEEQQAYLQEMADDITNNLSNWIVDNTEIGADVDEIVEDSFQEGLSTGNITQEDADAIYEDVLGRIQETVPPLREELGSMQSSVSEKSIYR